MKQTNTTAYHRRFFKEVTALFPFRGKREKEYLKHFESEIDTYLEEFPDSTYEEMIEAIGTPKDVVENYFQNVDNQHLISHMKKSRYIRIAAAVIIGMVLIFLVYRSLLIYQSYLDSKDSIIIYESTEIQEDPTPKGETK